MTKAGMWIAIALAAAVGGYLLLGSSGAEMKTASLSPAAAERTTAPKGGVAPATTVDPRILAELKALRQRVEELEASGRVADPVASNEAPGAEPLLTKAELIAERSEAHLRAWEAEPTDRAWSRTHEDDVRDELTTAYPDLKDVQVDCRTSLCRIEIDHDSEAEAEHFRTTPRVDLFRNGASLFAEEDARSVVYVPREAGGLTIIDGS